FPEEDITGYNFEYADLTKATLRGVDLRAAVFVGANVSHADLRGAKYDREYFREITIGFETALTGDDEDYAGFDPSSDEAGPSELPLDVGEQIARRRHLPGYFFAGDQEVGRKRLADHVAA